MRAHLHQRVAFAGCYEALRALADATSASSISIDRTNRMLEDAGLDSIDMLHEMEAIGLVRLTFDTVSVTTLGMRTAALLEALNGGRLATSFDKLARYDPGLRRYELVQEGMTKEFLRSLVQRPGFRRLYICSPWISFDEVDYMALVEALAKATSRGREPELLIITRPDDRGRAPAAIGPLRNLGAGIYLHPRLHSKLYIREPDLGGGYSMAIVGSQNLTRSNYLELGIRVNNDGNLIGQLVRYFINISNSSEEYDGKGEP